MAERPHIDMRQALGAKLRKAFAPAGDVTPAFEASVADLLHRLDRVGADRRRPFRHEEHR